MCPLLYAISCLSLFYGCCWIKHMYTRIYFILLDMLMDTLKREYMETVSVAT